MEPTWLCPDLAARERLLDMDERLQGPRTAAMGLLGVGVVAAVPYLGWRPMLLLGLAVVVLVLASRLSTRLKAPEYGMALSWTVSQVVLAIAVVLTGGVESYVLSWLIIP